jgi:hypothetical protein
MDPSQLFYLEEVRRDAKHAITLSADDEIIRESLLKTFTAVVNNTKAQFRDTRTSSPTQLIYSSRSLGMVGPGRRNAL